MSARTSFTIPQDVLDVLNSSTITDKELKLPPYKLSNYQAVNKILVAAGGKWNRSTQSHIFTSDPREKLGLALETGEIVNEKNKYQAFFTPKELAAKVVSKIDVKGHVVLEPSAGEGALADACMEAGAKCIKCFELNPECVVKLENKGYNVIEGDFLAMLPVAPESYSTIVMNPPFTKNQDIKHVEHALKFLAPKGILIAIMGGNTERKQFQALLEKLPANYEIEEIEPGAFKESGTMISTIILTVFSH